MQRQPLQTAPDIICSLSDAAHFVGLENPRLVTQYFQAWLGRWLSETS